MTHFFDSNISFKDVIDLETFKNLGKYYDGVFDNAYFVDKDRAYYYHADSCGGNLEVDTLVDRETLHLLTNTGYFYADKDHIYSAYTGYFLAGADRETFVASKYEPYGKDKNGYWIWWGDRVSKRYS